MTNRSGWSARSRMLQFQLPEGGSAASTARGPSLGSNFFVSRGVVRCGKLTRPSSRLSAGDPSQEELTSTRRVCTCVLIASFQGGWRGRPGGGSLPQKLAVTSIGCCITLPYGRPFRSRPGWPTPRCWMGGRCDKIFLSHAKD